MAVLAAIIILVSIRAPARGATSRGTYYIKQELFQSALPRGERPSAYRGAVVEYVSIRAPARGATMTESCKTCDFYVSIRAPARGATGCAGGCG